MPARSSTARPNLTRFGRFALGGAALLMTLQLAACGNKGPLSLPGDPAGSPQQSSEETEQNERDR